MEMLQLNDLHKTFNPGTVNEKVALNGVSLQMEAGDFATIVGSNGAGKSTLFNAITGGFIADEGSILLGGQDITFAPEHQRSKVIGHLFQDPLKGTAPNMTIEENLALAYLRAGTAPNAIFSRISRKDKALFREKLALLDMGLEDRMKQPVGLLSGGQRQALTLLMATLVTPKLLLLDEHTAALDPATAEKVLALTKSIVAEKKITCLMVTHNMHQALELGNRTLMMDSGRIVFDVKGEERSRMTVDDLLEKFRVQLAGGGIQLLDTADIYYLETHSRMLYYHTAKGEFAVRASLQSAEKQLAEYHFVRCNQCYLVNLVYVKGIESDFALVKDDRLEISRRQRTAFLTAVASYMGGVL